MGIDSPATITTTDRDVAVAEKALSFNREIIESPKDALDEPWQNLPSSSVKSNVQDTDTAEDKPTTSTDEDIRFLLDAVSNILPRLEALEDLNLEERLAKHNARAPFKI